MTNTKHAPGPWYVDSLDSNVYGANHRTVPQNDADARLIAAAPDLLAALQDMLATHTARNVCGLERLTRVHQAARAAIAKATGDAS